MSFPLHHSSAGGPVARRRALSREVFAIEGKPAQHTCSCDPQGARRRFSADEPPGGRIHGPHTRGYCTNRLSDVGVHSLTHSLSVEYRRGCCSDRSENSLKRTAREFAIFPPSRILKKLFSLRYIGEYVRFSRPNPAHRCVRICTNSNTCPCTRAIRHTAPPEALSARRSS